MVHRYSILARMTGVAPCVGALVLAAVAWGSPLEAQRTHTDRRWGFKIRVPKDFRKIPPRVNERWIIGKYQSEKNYFTKDGYEFKPVMNLIIFPESRKKQKRVEVEEKGDEIRINFRHKYKSYKDYLKANFAGGGYYFSKEEEGKIGGIPVTKYEVKVEKLANTKQRVIAWVFHLPGGDLAVDFNVLERRYAKMKGFAYGSLRSFKSVERTEQGEADEPADEPSIKIKKGELGKNKKKTLLERMRERTERADKIIKKAIAELPKGWKVKKSRHFTVLTHVDARFTKKIITQAEAIRGWLDKNLAEMGDENVPMSIIRICVDSDEESAYGRGSADSFSFQTREILVSKRTNLGRRGELEWLSGAISRQWFADKNAELRWYMPGWIGTGLNQYMSSGMAKGRKLVFKPDDWEKTQLREGEKKGHMIECRALIKMTDKEFRAQYNKSQGAARYQSASIIRYLYSPKCRRNKLTKNVVLDYLRNLNDIVKELKAKEEAEDKKKGRKRAETEEEEEARRKARAEAAKKQAQYVVDEVFKRTFGKWTNKQWSSFQRGWARAML